MQCVLIAMGLSWQTEINDRGNHTSKCYSQNCKLLIGQDSGLLINKNQGFQYQKFVKHFLNSTTDTQI